MRFHIDSKYNKGDTVYSSRLMGAGKIKDVRFSYFGNVFKIEYLVEDTNSSRSWLSEEQLSTKGW